MSLSKKLFGIERKKPYTPAISGPGLDNSQFNACLDLIDQFELSEEELLKIVEKAAKTVSFGIFNNPYYTTDPVAKSRFIAKAIKQNANKIFVRKS